MRIALAQINPTVGDLDGNCKKICSFIEKARKGGARMVVFPELALCGYPPEDLLLLSSFVIEVHHQLEKIIAASKEMCVIVGTVRENPTRGEKDLFNTAALIEDRHLVGFQDKSLLPDYDVFSERRYFEPAARTQVWELAGRRIAVTICEDLWQHADAVEYSHYPRDPVVDLMDQSPDLLINIAASPFAIGRQEVRFHVCTAGAHALECPALMCNQVGGNNSLIFDGHSLFVDKEGKLLAVAKGFEEDLLVVDTESEGEGVVLPLHPTEDLYHALVLGLRDYFHKLGFQKACFGLSGGIDSAVVACIAADALGKENILALGMPSRFSSKESLEDAKKQAKTLGIAFEEVSIEGPFESFLKLLEPHFKGKEFDVTEENLQARIRGMILMAFSNKQGYLVLSTGNKSEMAMGYATLYGDMCGGLGVLSDVSKEQVYALAHWINREREQIPPAVIKKTPSAELRSGQKDEDSLPPYEILDRVLEEYVEEHNSPEEIAQAHAIPLPLVQDLVKRIHRSEYKRRQAPPGLRVTKKAFSVGRRFPIVQKWNTDNA